MTTTGRPTDSEPRPATEVDDEQAPTVLGQPLRGPAPEQDAIRAHRDTIEAAAAGRSTEIHADSVRVVDTQIIPRPVV